MLNNLNQTLYFIAGPTCIGKSSLAIRLAKKINGVIINSDSMQVYSNLNILTARPSKKDLLEIKHELYGYVDAAVRYNVSNWCNDVLKIIKNNEENNLPSIIVGGSGMYIDSLLNGLIPIPPIPEKYKNDSLSLLNEVGTKKFTEIINNFDSESLSKILTNAFSASAYSKEWIKVNPKSKVSLKSYLQESEKLTSPKLGSPHSNKSPRFNSKFVKAVDFEELVFLILQDEKLIKTENSIINLPKWVMTSFV